MKKRSFLLLATTLIYSSNQSWAMIDTLYDENKENVLNQVNNKKNIPTQGDNQRNVKQHRAKPTGLKILKNLSQTNSQNKKLPNNEILGTVLQGFEKLQQTTYKEDKDLWARLAYAFELSPFSSSMLKKSPQESQTSFNRKKVLSGIHYLYGMLELAQSILDPDKPHLDRAAEHLVQSCIYGGYEAVQFLQQTKQHENENAKLLYDRISYIFNSKTNESLDNFITRRLNTQRLLNLTDDSVDQYLTYWAEGRWKENPAEALYYSKEIIKVLEAALKDRKKLTPVKRQQQDFFARAKKGQPKFLNVFAEIVHEKSYGFVNTQDANELNVLINKLLSDETKAKSPVKKLYVQGLLSGKYGFKEDKKAAELFLAKDENKHSVAAYVLKMNNNAQNIKQASDIRMQEETLREIVNALIDTALKVPSKTISMGKKRLFLPEAQRNLALRSLGKKPKIKIPRQIIFHPTGLEVLENLLQSNFQNGELPSFEVLERQAYKEDSDLWERWIRAIKLSPFPLSDESQTSSNRKIALAWTHQLYGFIELIQDTPDADKPHFGQAAEHFARACMYGGGEAIQFLTQLQLQEHEYAKALYEHISDIFTLNTWKNIDDFIENHSTIQRFQRLTDNSIYALLNITKISDLKKVEKGLRWVAYTLIETALTLPREEVSFEKEPASPRVLEIIEPLELILPPVEQLVEQAEPEVAQILQVAAVPQSVVPILPLDEQSIVQKGSEAPQGEAVVESVECILPPVARPVQQEERRAPQIKSQKNPPLVPIAGASLIKPVAQQTTQTVFAAVNKHGRVKSKSARKVINVRKSKPKKTATRPLPKTQKTKINWVLKKTSRVVQQRLKIQKWHATRVARKKARIARQLSRAQKQKAILAERTRSRVARQLSKTQVKKEIRASSKRSRAVR